MANFNVKTLSSNIAHAIRGALTLGEFLKREFGEDKKLLGKLVRGKSIGMVAGPRGGGKSWVVLLMSYSVAGGMSETAANNSDSLLN